MGNHLFYPSTPRPSSPLRKQGQLSSHSSEDGIPSEHESLVVLQGDPPETSLSPQIADSPATVVSIPSCNLKCIRFSNVNLQEISCRPMPLRHVNKLASFPCEASAEMKTLHHVPSYDTSLRKSQSLDGFDGRESRRWECASPLCHVELSPVPVPFHEEDDGD